MRDLVNTLGEGVPMSNMSIRYFNLQGSQFRKIGKMGLNRFIIYEGWNFNSGNYLFTTDTK